MRYGSITRRATGRPARQKRHLKTRRRWTWRSLFRTPIPQLAVLVLVLCGVYALATSRVFAISTVQIVGDGSLSAGVLRQQCACVGDNIFLTRPGEIRRRLDRISWLDVRQVYARLPDRLVIDAGYRQPVALWRTTAATYTVDSSGMVLYDMLNPPVPAYMVPSTSTVPIVYNAFDAVLRSGQYVSSVAIQMVRATRQSMGSDIAPTVDRFRWSPYSGLTAHSRLGWWFSLGIHLGADLQNRLQAIDVANKDKVMKTHHCNYVDLEPWPNVYCNFQLQWHGAWGPGTR